MIQPAQTSLESEAGLRVLFECATISILVVNAEGVIELCNPCAEKLFGYNPRELAGRQVEELIPENLLHKHVHHRTNYFERPRTRPMGLGMELYARKKNNEVFPVEISLGHYKFDGETLAVAFITDITDRLQRKQLLAERESLFRNMADNSPVMIWRSGTDKLCTYFNKTWLEFTGRTMEQELGNGWAEGVHPEDIEKCLFIYNHAFDSRQPFTMEYRLKRHDGRYRWLQDVGKPTYSSENIFTGYIGSCSDIHDQRMMKEELELLVSQRTNELHDALIREKEINELKSRFVSMASHEFRSPLSVVLSSTSLIERYLSPQMDERVEKHILKIKASLGNLTNILDDFLSLDKLEQDKVEINGDKFNIVEFMQTIIEDVYLFRRKDQYISVRNGGGPDVSLDQKKLRYILVNLISNSMKYSPEGTEINLDIETRDDIVTISIQDHGIGIPEEEQNCMFNKFFRATNTGNVQGIGLGLTIVKRYVELMGGEIRFVSQQGQGTTFTIDIPCS